MTILKRVSSATTPFLVAVMGLFALQANAQIIADNANLPPQTDIIPGTTPGYLSQYHVSYVINGQTVTIDNLVHFHFTNSIAPPQNVGNMTVHHFNSTLAFDLVVPGTTPIHEEVTGVAVTVDVSKVNGPDNSSIGTYDTQMTQLDVPSFSTPFGSVELQINPNYTSTGETIIADDNNGNYQIQSFFDIFTDLSIDNGTTWIPSTDSSGATTYAHVELGTVPEPGAVGLCGAGLVTVAGIFRRRRQR